MYIHILFILPPRNSAYVSLKIDFHIAPQTPSYMRIDPEVNFAVLIWSKVSLKNLLPIQET